MQHTSRKAFGPIRDAYAFFQRHTTETEADIRAYLPHLLAVTMGDQPIRMLDFGCGDGTFTAALLDHAAWQPALLALFDPYVQNGQVAMRLAHEHFIVRRHAAGGATHQT